LKIYVDSNEAKLTAFGSKFISPIIDKKGVWLPIQVEKQERSRWCWAAISCSILNYYRKEIIEQAVFVNSLVRKHPVAKDQYSEKDNTNQNVNFKLEIALKKVNCFSHWTIGKPSFERIQFEINQGKPFCVRLEWFKGGAHYVLIKGYNLKNKTILIEDSLHDFSIHQFDTFPQNYCNGGAVWTETYWTTKK